MFHSITVNAPGYRIGGNELVVHAFFFVPLIHGELKFSSITIADSQTWIGPGGETPASDRRTSTARH